MGDRSNDHLPPISDFSGPARGELVEESESPPEIPGYRIFKLLGRGGMGLVFQAVDEQLKREVAIKFVRPNAGSSPRTIERFQREAEAVARLQHANIIQIFSYGSQQPPGQRRIPYLVLEFAAFGTLSEKIAGKPQAPRDAAHIAQLLALAVQYAHERGIIHRDLKPQNVLLTPAPKIADFGLARLIEDEQELTVEHARPGTPCNMSPEQISGEYPIGPATDIYALGTILYELLTGRPPHKAESRSATLHLVQHEKPVSPSRYAKGISPDLEAICLKCLAKLPQDRYTTAAQLADDLQAYLDLRPTIARPRNLLQRTALWTRRYPVTAALLLLAVVLAAAGAVAFQRDLTKGALIDSERRDAAASSIAADEAKAAASQLQRHRARQQAISNYALTIQLASNTWKERKLNEASSLLAAAPPEFRGWEWKYLHRLCNDQQLTLSEPADAAFFSVEGERLITCSADHVTTWDPKSGKVFSRWNVRESLPIAETAATLTILGRVNEQAKTLLLVSYQNECYLLDAFTGMRVELDAEIANPKIVLCVPLGWQSLHSDPAPTKPRVGPISRLIYRSTYENKVRLRDFTTGKSYPLRWPLPELHENRAWLNNEFLAVLSAEGKLNVHDLGSERSYEVSQNSPNIRGAIFIDGMTTFATLEKNLKWELTLRDTKDGRPLQSPRLLEESGEELTIRLFAANEHGFYFASRDSDATVHLDTYKQGDIKHRFRTQLAYDRPQRRGSPSAQLDRLLVFDEHDWRRFAFGYPDGTVEICQSIIDPLHPPVGAFNERVIATGSDGPLRDIAFSPSGNDLVTVARDGTVRVWTIARSQRATEYRNPAGILPRESTRPPAINEYLSSASAPSRPELKLPASTSNLARIRWRAAEGALPHDTNAVWSNYHYTRFPSNADAEKRRKLETFKRQSDRTADSRAHPLAETVDLPLPGSTMTLLTWLGIDNSSCLIADSPQRLYALGATFDQQPFLSLLVFDRDAGDQPIADIHLDPLEAVSMVAFSNKAHRLAVADKSPILHIYDTDTGERLTDISVRNEQVTSICFDPRDESLAVGYHSGYVQVINLESGSPVFEQSVHGQPIGVLRFSPRGDLLVSGERTEKDRFAVDRTNPQAVAPLKIWKVKENALHLSVPQAWPDSELITFNADQSRLATVHPGRGVEIRDTEFGILLLELDNYCCQPHVLCFNPADNSILASLSACQNVIAIWSAAEPHLVPLSPPENR